MPGLTPDYQREIRQRWLVVKHYLRLARERQKALPPYQLAKAVGELALPFAVKGPIDPKTRSLNILGANLSSAALRLAIIEERLDAAGLSWTMKDYRQECAKPYDREAFKRVFLARKNEWLHVMTRNNLIPVDEAHKAERYGSMDAVGAMTIGEMYDALTAIFARLDQQLRDDLQVL